MRNLLNTKTTGLVITLALLLCAGATQKVHAELLYETINDIQVPTNVTWGTQVQWQGHAITKVTQQGNQYIVEVARDSEPHELPWFTVSFDLDWNYQGTVRTTNPAVEKRMADEKAKADADAQRKAQEDADKARKEQERLQREQQEREQRPEPPRPTDPPARPPDEEPTPTEPPDDDTTPPGSDE